MSHKKKRQRSPGALNVDNNKPHKKLNEGWKCTDVNDATIIGSGAYIYSYYSVKLSNICL